MEELKLENSQVSIEENLEMKCPASNKNSWICINPECENFSLHCGEDDCPSCLNHFRCNSIKLKPIEKDIQSLWKANKQLKEGFKNILIQMIGSLIKDEKQEDFEVPLSGKDKLIAKKLYFHQKNFTLIGKDAQKFVQQIRKKERQVQTMIRSLLIEYEQKTKKTIEELKQLQQKLYQAFSRGESQEKNYKEEGEVVDPSEKPQIIKKRQLEMSDYNIQNILDLWQLQFLKKSFKRFPTKFIHHFRASEFGFKAASFHQKCDGIKNTLTIIQTEGGNLYAGFSEYKWNYVRNGSVWEKSNHFNTKAFLISFETMQKRTAIDGDAMIYCYSGYGPCFGCFDLCITDECHLYPQSYESLSKYFPNGKKTEEESIGLTKFFKVKEYDVYEVIYK